MSVHIGIGEILSLGSAAAWAVGVIAYRQLGDRLTPLRLNFLKNTLVLGALLPLAMALEGPLPPPLSPMEWLRVLGSGVLGIALADTLYFGALNALGAARMGVIGNLYSPLVVLLSFVLLGEQLRALQWAGFVLVSAGVLLTAWVPAHWRGNAAHPLRGVLLGAAAIALMALAVVMIKRVLEQQPLLWITSLRMLGAWLGMLVLAAWRGQLSALHERARPVPWRQLLFAAGVGQGLAMLLWLGGYKYTSASVAAILNETASVFILILAWWWLGERPGARGLGGVVLALAGVGLILAG
jgi:drug/metabolite transporter (DMT)-like permease